MFSFRPTFLVLLLFVGLWAQQPQTEPPFNIQRLGYPEGSILQATNIHNDIVAILTNQNILLLFDQKNTLQRQVQTCSATGFHIKKDSYMLRAKPFSQKMVIQLHCKQSSNQYFQFDIDHDTIQKIKDQSSFANLEEIYKTNLLHRKQSRILLNCGNGKLDGNETCDDGNTNSSDGCSSTCTREYCGDGIINNAGLQQCDDGNTKNNDGCSSQCIIQCGNLKLDGNQTCDDGNRKDGDGCNSQCKIQQNSTTIPLAVGIPVAAIALVGIGVAGASAAQGGATAASQGIAGVNYISPDNPPKVLEIEQGAKIIEKMQK